MTMNDHLRQSIMYTLGVKEGVESYHEFYDYKTFKPLKKAKLIHGKFWLPDQFTLTQSHITQLITLGLKEIIADDQAQCPGDQHPRLVIVMKV